MRTVLFLAMLYIPVGLVMGLYRQLWGKVKMKTGSTVEGRSIHGDGRYARLVEHAGSRYIHLPPVTTATLPSSLNRLLKSLISAMTPTLAEYS